MDSFVVCFQLINFFVAVKSLFSANNIHADIPLLLAQTICTQFNLKNNFSSSHALPQPLKLPIYGITNSACVRVRWQICARRSKCKKFVKYLKKHCEEDREPMPCSTIERNAIETTINSSFKGVPRAGLRDIIRRWPNRTKACELPGTAVHPRIPYTFDEAMENGKRTWPACTAMRHIEACTCIRFEKFIKYNPFHKDYVHITDDTKICESQVGRIGGEQILRLGPRCLYNVGIHEFVHAIGFRHEQNRPDRDEYVEVYLNNVKEGYERAFEKWNESEWNGFGSSYDYNSIMHYGEAEFAKPNTIVLKPTRPGSKIGQRILLSLEDMKQINRMYGCEDSIREGCELYPKCLPSSCKLTEKPCDH